MELNLLHHYNFPFKLHEYQKEDIASLATFNRCGLYQEVGLGKSLISVGIALTQALEGRVDQIIVVSPPSLITQWAAWIDTLSKLNDNQITSTVYRGTPAKRKKLDLTSDFIFMSIDILKRDIDYLIKHFNTKSLSVIVDEAASVRRSATKNFRAVKRLSSGNHVQLLTATPIASSPLNAYGLIKLITPDVYRNFGQFKRLHVEKEDFWGSPCAFGNLDLLHDNLMMQAVQRKAEDLIELPEIIYKPVLYDLSTKHYSLYNELMSEQILVLEDKVVDATDVMRLRHISQQLVTSPQKFCDTEIKSEVYNLVDRTLEDVGNKKLILFANYRLTNEQVFKHVESKGLNPVLVYGGITPTERDKRLQAFLTDPECRVLVASPRSCGVGLNLQSASNTIMFIEMPLTSADFIQAIGRVHRQGQKETCVVIIAIARKTIQEHIKKAVVDREDIVQQVFTTPQSLRKAIYGG